MVNVLLQIVQETWSILEDASVFLLIGFALAGVLAVVVPAETFLRHLGTGRVRSVLWAASLGAPLPLCSCGVLPTALALRRQGATDGATVAFLVATPETGLDSIAVSYSLTDPLLTFARPVAGIAAAITAGVAANVLGRPNGHRPRDEPARFDQTLFSGHACAQPAHATAGSASLCCDDPAETERGAATSGRWKTITATTRRVGRYAFRDLLDETSHWLALGIVLSAMVAVALPAELIERYLGGGLVSMLMMIVLGMPIYACASSSTPVAAALVLKGLSPGAALVFLLTGPATNLGSLVLVSRFLGGRVTALYLGVTIAVALLAGTLLNSAYHFVGLNPRATFGSGALLLPAPVKIAGAVIFLGLLLDSFRRAPMPREWGWLHQSLTRLVGLSVSSRVARAVTAATLVVLYVSSGLFQVGPGSVGIVSRFGRVVASDLQPGLHARLPWPFAADTVVDVAGVRRMAFGLRSAPASERALKSAPRQDLMFATPAPLKSGGVMFRREAAPQESFFLTGDGNLIDLRFVVQYHVRDALAFAYNVANPEGLLRTVALASMRSAAAAVGIDAIYTTARSTFEQQVARDMQEALDSARSGLAVLSVHLLYVHPPDEVHDAFRDIASAQEDKLRTINRAETFAVEKVNQGKAEAAAMMEQALGFKQERIRRAQGDAAAFAVRLRGYEAAPDLARLRLRLEAAETALSGAQKIITPGAAGLRDIDIWLTRPLRSGEEK